MRIETISPEALRRYIQTRHEKEYLLVDVRQPEEYRRGHIPGARLIPLPRLARDMDRLPAGKELVFYCHVGGRSMAAAEMVAEEGWDGPIHNLTGGIAAWDGARLEDIPKLRLFANRSAPEIFRTAMELEKGAQMFYETAGAQNAETPWGSLFARLAKAERAHARAVHGFWQQTQPDLEPFEVLYDAMSGEILEGGMALEEALQRLAVFGESTCMRLVELALQIEYAAFDLYRNLSDQDGPDAVQDAFISLAQAEKAHMKSLIDAIEMCSDQ